MALSGGHADYTLKKQQKKKNKGKPVGTFNNQHPFPIGLKQKKNVNVELTMAAIDGVGGALLAPMHM